MQVSDHVSIVQAASRNLVSNTLAVAASRCEVAAVSEKAVKLSAASPRGKTIEAWFPRKALRPIGDSTTLYNSNNQHFTVRLASWFRPEGWTAKFLELTTGL
jgi:hypothetical protein